MCYDLDHPDSAVLVGTLGLGHCRCGTTLSFSHGDSETNDYRGFLHFLVDQARRSGTSSENVLRVVTGLIQEKALGLATEESVSGPIQLCPPHVQQAQAWRKWFVHSTSYDGDHLARGVLVVNVMDLPVRTVSPLPAHVAPAHQELGPVGHHAEVPNQLLADIVNYRLLRGRALSGALLDSDESACLVRLETTLREHADVDVDEAERRFFRRFDCRVPVQLVRVGESSVDVWKTDLLDVSAGGARLRHREFIESGRAVFVSLMMPTAEGGVRRVTLDARVAWCAGGSLGVRFAGLPRVGMGDAGYAVHELDDSVY